jgi:hypothetical protein
MTPQTDRLHCTKTLCITGILKLTLNLARQDTGASEICSMNAVVKGRAHMWGMVSDHIVASQLCPENTPLQATCVC